MRKLLKLTMVFTIMLILLTGFGEVLAAKMAPGVIKEDFGCKGVMLGEKVDLPKMEKAFGKVLFDKERSVFGLKIKYYVFRYGIEVGANSAEKIVDIVIKDEEYQARNGVRYGATSAKIARVFGQKASKEFIGGQIWCIFLHPEEKYSRLLLEMDTEKNALASFRITSLPLTDEEADERAINDEEWESNDLNAVMMRKKEIDMSAVIKNEVTVKGRFSR